MTGWILLRFRELVKKFQPRQRLPKADRIVGLIPLWLTSIIPLWPTRRQADGQSIHRASDSSPATVQDMGVDHGCSNVGVPEQLLNCSDVVAILKQVRSNAFKPFDYSDGIK